jgi:spore coat protein CotH
MIKIRPMSGESVSCCPGVDELAQRNGGIVVDDSLALSLKSCCGQLSKTELVFRSSVKIRHPASLAGFQTLA